MTGDDLMGADARRPMRAGHDEGTSRSAGSDEGTSRSAGHDEDACLKLKTEF